MRKLCLLLLLVVTAKTYAQEKGVHFKDNNEPGFMDTYANILYKLGKTDEAIMWEQKAMSLPLRRIKKDLKK